MSELVLYHDHDSFQSLKVRLCLFEKKIAWQSELVCLARFENLRPDYVRLNPQGVVPTLWDGRAYIPESSIINEYLNERFPDPPLLPIAPAARAQVRLWARFEDDIVHPAVRLATFNLMIKQRVRLMPADEFEALIATHPWPVRASAYRKAATSDIDGAQVHSAVQSFKVIIAKLEDALARQSWLVEDRYSLADVAMTPFVDRVERLGMAVLWKDALRLRAWIDKIRQRPNYAPALAADADRMPPPDVDLVAFHLKQAAA